MANKTYLVILCGAADRPIHTLASHTPIEAAHTPHLDRLAQKGAQSLLTIIRDGICPESDSGAMALLSYDPHLHYTGRGPLEGLGCGFLALGDNAVSFRINFASYNAAESRLDRRTARDVTNTELQTLVDEIRSQVKLEQIPGVSFEVTAFGRHRGIICFRSTGIALSGKVSNTDPGFTNVGPFGVPVAEYKPVPNVCVALHADDRAAQNTAVVVNEFVAKSAAVLGNSPVNLARLAKGQLPANIILFRDGGDQPKNMQSFKDRFGRSLSFHGQIPAEKGLMALVGGEFAYCRLGENEDEKAYLERTAKTLLDDKADVVAVHLKGADEPGHDGDIAAKVSAIEILDRHFVGPLSAGLDDSDICIITSDHATPCELRIHSADPVAAVVVGRDIPSDNTIRFGEAAAAAGGLPVQMACDLLPHIFGQRADA